MLISFGQGEWTWALKFSVNQDGTGGHYDVLKVQVLAQTNPDDPQERRNLGVAGSEREGRETDKKTDKSQGTHEGVLGVKVQVRWFNADYVVDKVQLFLETLTRTPKES